MASHTLFPSILPGAREDEEDREPLTTDALDGEDPEEPAEEAESEAEPERDGRTLVRTSDLLEEGLCPWCDEYEGDSPAQHAAAKHPEAWAAYKDAREEDDD